MRDHRKEDSEAQRHGYVSSRFNSVGVASDGVVVVWNSLTGRINSFGPEHSAKVLNVLENGAPSLDSRMAAYMADRGLLVKDPGREYEKFRTQALEQHHRTDVLDLILLASEECNFRCSYCYETFPRGVMEPEVRLRVKKLLSSKVPLMQRFSIAWFGGEPLHGFDAIAEIAPYAKKLAGEHGVQFHSHMTTNGYLLDREKAEKLIEWGVSRFQVTLDGPAEIHDKHRALAGGGRTFDVILENLCSLQEIEGDYFAMIGVNFDRETADRLDGFLEQVARQFGKDDRFAIRFHPVGKWGGPNDSELDVFGARHGQVKRLNLLHVAGGNGMTIKGTLLDACGAGDGVCYAARPYNFIIGANGAVMKCTVALDTDDRNVVGWIKEDGTLDLDQRLLKQWVQPAFESDSVCQDCSVLASCQGMSCPLVRIEHGRRPCVSTPKPALAEEVLSVPGLKELRSHRGASAS